MMRIRPLRDARYLALIATVCACANGQQTAATTSMAEPAVVSSMAPAAAITAYGPDVEDAYPRVRAATARFHTLDSAVAAGYPATVAECIDHADHGAMGYHHVDRARMDARLEIEHPEILLYEQRADGSYALNGVEYIIPYSVWPRDSTPPRLMGRDLFRSDELRLWYLHMWVWTENPAGLFADWNPAVQCRERRP